MAGKNRWVGSVTTSCVCIVVASFVVTSPAEGQGKTKSGQGKVGAPRVQPRAVASASAPSKPAGSNAVTRPSAPASPAASAASSASAAESKAKPPGAGNGGPLTKTCSSDSQCGGKLVCGAGQCFCSTGWTNCEAQNHGFGVTACMDLVNDADNCGACGKACSQTQVCKSGKCGSCAGGRVRCDTDACVDFATDEDNCGKCGHVCPQGWTCSRARCEP